MDRIVSRGRERPAEVWIEPLPWFGTTWYERGPAYWWRRVAVSLVLLLSVAILLPFVYSALAAISTWGQIALVITLALMASTGVATAVWMWRHWWVDVPTPSRRAAGAAAGGGAAIGLLARAGSVLGAAFVLIGALTILVPMVVLFLFSLGPQLPPERRARRRLEQSHSGAAG
jgi:putative flippase GtrA